MKNLGRYFVTSFLISLSLLVDAQVEQLTPQQINDQKKAAFIARSLAKWKPFHENRIVKFVDTVDVSFSSNQYPVDRAAPGNDDECSATNLSTSGCVTGQTTVDATTDVTGGCASLTSLTVWYEFTLTGTNNFIDISFANETMGAEVELILMTGPCGSLSGVNIQCGDPASTTFNFSGLTAGTQYFLQVGNESGQQGGFDICAAEGETLPGIITGPEQDCDNAINICSSSYTEINSYTGSGSSQELSGSCLLGNETNSVWYVFTVQDISGGNDLEFEIQTAADYDFALYDITSIGCAGIPSAAPVRCNFSGTLGNTGLTSGSATTLPALAEAGGGSNVMANLNDVAVGQTFALVVDNWSGDNNGYTIDFSNSQATLFDGTTPSLSLVDDCSDNTFTVTIDEDILCSSIGAGEFTLTNTATATDYTGNITGVSGSGCGTVTNTITITHDGTMPSGPYDLDVALGNLQDLCGNTVQVGDKLSFDHLGTVGITASSTDICNAGDAVTLTATGGGAGATYVWTPGISGSSLSEVVNPLVSTNYSLSVTYGGCTKATTQSIEVVDNVITTIDPVDPQICSGTTSLTASTTINGNPCVGCTYVWDDGLSQTTPTANTLSPGTYSVVVATSGGCSGDNLPASTISLASGGGGTSCDILYVASGASGGGLTKDDPMDFEAALAAALCSNTIIKCQVGDYSYDKFIQINSYVTIEGGYNSGFTQKISSWNTGSCTRFIRDNATADGGSGNDYTMFKTVNSSQGWRIQDVKIVMPNHTLGSGYQNFGIQLGGANTGYKIVRCIIDGGTAG